MCGIAGFASHDVLTGAADAEAVKKMTDRMYRRGPDASGLWSADQIVLGHSRLSILDLDPRSTQPMASGSGRYQIVFNGEIYNFRQLRRELEDGGVSFRTSSDTEVLLALFERDREAMLPKLRGMFAIAIWDTSSKELFMARDPYGIKPLYYAQTLEGFVFASQVKAILASGLVQPERETAGVAGFYLFGSIPEPWTLYRGILSLPAGHCMTVRNGRHEAPVCWNDIRENWRVENAPISELELQQRIREAVADSVAAHLVSDVPVSIFLSGGIDSGTVAGMVAQCGMQVEAITIGFEEFKNRHDDEVPLAAEIARYYNIPHFIRMISHEELESDIPSILDAMDQPTVDGINSWFASKATAERGYKVVLSGTGGDELFYGYHRLVDRLPRTVKFAKTMTSIPGSKTLLDYVFSYLPEGPSPPKLRGAAKYADTIEGAYFLKRALFLPEELPLLMGEEAARDGLARLGGVFGVTGRANAVTASAGLCLLDSTLYLRNQLLRDADWTSMAHSLELRTPLVDAKLLADLRNCHSGFAKRRGKQMLANSPAKPLPDAVVHRVKTGFSTPMTSWVSAMVEDSESAQRFRTLRGHKTPWARLWAIALLDASFVSSRIN